MGVAAGGLVSVARRAAWGLALLLVAGTAIADSEAAFEAAVAALGRGDFDTAVPELRRLAGEGDRRAGDTLAGLYLEGIGVERDLPRAMGWYCRLAHDRRGGPEVMRAAWYLAEYFRTGGGVPGPAYNQGRREDEDPPRAYFWFALMAGQEGLFDTVDARSVILGKIGLNAVGGVLFAEEKEALARATAAWRPDREVASAPACLLLPEGL